MNVGSQLGSFARLRMTERKGVGFPAFGFSLVEVILAVGIFALAVPTMLALLAALGHQSATSEEALVAQRVPDSVRVELTRLAQPDFEGLAAQVPVMTSTLAPGLALVASRNVLRVHSRDYLPPTAGLPVEDQYFLIQCWKFEDEPLRFESPKAFLALAVRVSWPYQLPDGSVTATGTRSHFTFTVVLNR